MKNSSQTKKSTFRTWTGVISSLVNLRKSIHQLSLLIQKMKYSIQMRSTVYLKVKKLLERKTFFQSLESENLIMKLSFNP